MNEQDQAVADYLASQNITFKAVHLGRGLDTDNGAKAWDHDRWHYTFSRPGLQDMCDEFKTGSGNRKLNKYDERAYSQMRKTDRSNYPERWKEERAKAVAPTAASVLYCTLSDARGAEQNFRDWARDFGYDTDSIKALGIYNACCKLLDDVRRFFIREQREALDKLLEDY
jgi:hypothetical protein